MHRLFTALILSAFCASPALAQDLNLNAHYEAMWQEQQAANRMAQQRAVALENQVGALEAQVQTDARLRELATQQATARTAAGTVAPVLPSNIDAWMADSNARVRAAAANRR